MNTSDSKGQAYTKVFLVSQNFGDINNFVISQVLIFYEGELYLVQTGPKAFLASILVLQADAGRRQRF